MQMEIQEVIKIQLLDSRFGQNHSQITIINRYY